MLSGTIETSTTNWLHARMYSMPVNGAECPAKRPTLKRACHPQEWISRQKQLYFKSRVPPIAILHGEAFMATPANKNKIRTFEAEIGLQNKNIEAGQNFTGS